jgi:hypothetical protein
MELMSICRTSCLGVTPSFKARVSVAVPYSSVPHMYSVLRFRVPTKGVYFGSVIGNGGLREYLSRIVQGEAAADVMVLTGCIHQH